MDSNKDNNRGGNPSRFLPAAEEALRKAGWFPGRVAPEEQLREWYLLRNEEEFGYCPIFPAALRALREFGGLHVEPVTDEGVTSAPVALHFDPFEGLGYVGEGLFVYGWVLEASLYPLGSFREEDYDYIVSIDERGQIYGLEYGLEFVATTLDEAINKCLTGTGEGAREVEHQVEKEAEGEAVYKAITEAIRNS